MTTRSHNQQKAPVDTLPEQIIRNSKAATPDSSLKDEARFLDQFAQISRLHEISRDILDTSPEQVVDHLKKIIHEKMGVSTKKKQSLKTNLLGNLIIPDQTTKTYAL